MACRVSVFQVWRDSDLVQRVPIIVTGNDFSTLFAPLVRDGRMAKFYWEPDRVDLLNICHQMYKVLALHKRSMPRQLCEATLALLRLVLTSVGTSLSIIRLVLAAKVASAPSSVISGLLRTLTLTEDGCTSMTLPSDVLLLLLEQDDGLSMGDMELILDSFKGQSLDFFGAMRSATYDNQIRDWIKEIVEDDINAEGANLQELSRRLINRRAAAQPICMYYTFLLVHSVLHIGLSPRTVRHSPCLCDPSICL